MSKDTQNYLHFTEERATIYQQQIELAVDALRTFSEGRKGVTLAKQTLEKMRALDPYADKVGVFKDEIQE